MARVNRSSIKWPQIIGYYLLACLLSTPFRLSKFAPGWYEDWVVSGQFVFVKGLFEAIGPVMSGLVAIIVSLKSDQKEINYFGNSIVGSVAFASATIIACSVIGLPTGNYSDHINGALTGAILLLYCLFEETFWRGYLQNALKPLSIIPRFLLIGILWYSWHLGFLNTTTLESQLIHLGLIIFGSFIIGKLAEDTKSILVAAGAHSVFNVFYALKIEMDSKLLIMAIMIAIWLVVRFVWYRKVEIEIF